MSSPRLPVTAALLFGPRSHSFGVPKAFLPWQGGSLAAHLVREARKHFKEVVAVSKSVEWIPRDVHGTVPLYLDHWETPGPLAGLATALPLAGQESVFLMSCHQPVLENTYLTGLWRAWERSEPVEALVPYLEGRWRPFRGLWSKAVSRVLKPGAVDSWDRLLGEEGLTVRRLTREKVGAWDLGLRSFRELESLQDWLELGVPQE